jgi:RNA polymerase sigma factor (sigma-70 family)
MSTNSAEAWSLATLQSGDRCLQEAFVDRFYAPLFRWLHWLGGDYEDAADLTQQTFAACWDSFRRADPSTDAQVWLFAIGRNVWRNAIRARDKRRRIREERVPFSKSQGANDTAEPDPLIAAECAAEIRESVADLPVDIREAVTLRYWVGLSYAQIAQTLSITPELARQRVFLGRNQLRRRLAPWAPISPEPAKGERA